MARIAFQHSGHVARMSHTPSAIDATPPVRCAYLPISFCRARGTTPRAPGYRPCAALVAAGGVSVAAAAGAGSAAAGCSTWS